MHTHIIFLRHIINSETSKGGIILSSIGYIQVNAYTSNARIPLKDVAITVTTTDGTAISMRLTDRSGRIEPIPIPVPSIGAGLVPNTDQIPFTAVNLYANLRGFKQIENENLQVFPETTTNQNLEMIPLSELPSNQGESQIFNTPSQNL